MREKLINLALLFVGAVVGVVALSRTAATQQATLMFGTFSGAPKALSLTASGAVNATVSSGGITYTNVTGGTSTYVPYFDTNGALTSAAGMFFDSAGRFRVHGQSNQTGGLVGRIRYTGEGFIRAAVFAQRDSNGNPTNGDGAEFLANVQDSNGNYSNIGGFIARTLDVTPAVMTGRLEFAVKPAGTYNTTFDITQMVINHNGNVGIGYYFGNTTLAAAPASALHIARDGSDPIGSASTTLTLERASNDTGAGVWFAKKARGTLTTLAAVQSSDFLGQAIFAGYQTTTGAYVNAASIQAVAAEGYTSTVFGSYFNFNVTAPGTAVLATSARITQAGFTATGVAPTVGNVGANSCGTTTATIAGSNQSGEITVGATSGTQCRVTTSQPAPATWNGSCNNVSTNADCTLTRVDTTHFDLIGTFGAGNVLTFITIPR